jgi:hypothetical protein
MDRIDLPAVVSRPAFARPAVSKAARVSLERSKILRMIEPALVGKLSYRINIGVDNKSFNEFKRQQGDRRDAWIFNLEDLCLFEISGAYPAELGYPSRTEPMTDPL